MAKGAVRRHQCRGLALMHGLAQSDRDGERLVLRIGGFDHRECLQRRFDVRQEGLIGGFLPPHVGRGRRPQRLRCQSVAAARRGQACDRVAGDADARQQRLQGELWMPRRRRDVLFLIARNQPPRFLIEIGVEPGQHHGAVRKPRDGGNQLCGRRDRAGRTRDDYGRVSLAGKPRRLGHDQTVAPLDRFDEAALLQDLRPLFDGDLQKLQRELPVLIEIVGHKLVELLPRHAARRHVVDQARQIVGERAGRGRRLRDQRRAAGAMDDGRVGPLGDELRQQETPLDRCERFRQRQGIGSDVAGHGFAEGDLVLVDIADGDDARQDRRVVFQDVQKGVARQPAGAPRRQIERGRRQGERIGRGGKAELAADQRLDQRPQKRRRRRNGENARCHFGFAENRRAGLADSNRQLRVLMGGGERRLRGRHRVRGADMHPYAVKPQAEQAALVA